MYVGGCLQSEERVKMQECIFGFQLQVVLIEIQNLYLEFEVFNYYEYFRDCFLYFYQYV